MKGEKISFNSLAAAGWAVFVVLFFVSNIGYANNELQFNKNNFTIVENGPANVSFTPYGIDIIDNAYAVSDSEYSSPIAQVKHQVDFSRAQFPDGPNGEFTVPIHDTFTFSDGAIVVDSTFRVVPQLTNVWIEPLSSTIAPSAPSLLYALSSAGGDGILSGNKDGVVVRGTGKYLNAAGILTERGRYVVNNGLPVFFDACTNTFHLDRSSK